MVGYSVYMYIIILVPYTIAHSLRTTLDTWYMPSSNTQLQGSPYMGRPRPFPRVEYTTYKREKSGGVFDTKNSSSEWIFVDSAKGNVYCPYYGYTMAKDKRRLSKRGCNRKCTLGVVAMSKVVVGVY